MTDPHRNPEATPAAPPAKLKQPPAIQEVKIVQHSQLFYWWPVWAVGFLLFGFSYIYAPRMALLPGESVIKRDTKDSYSISVNGQPPAKRSGEPLEVGQSIPLQDAKRPFGLHMAAQPYLGIIFALTLLLVIVITNVPLRGWGSIFVIVVTVGLCIIISLIPGAWQTILDLFYILDIHINAAGYLLLSLVLFAMWAITVFWFDPQVYILFTPGQMKVHEQIGGGETVYDTTGMMTQHLRTDLFRHWILGLGSGDLIVRTAGAQSHEFRFANVLFVGRKLQMIEDLQRERAVVKGG